MIRELRLWLLRCHACFHVLSDSTRQFCPECGSGNTLRRVNYVVKSSGEKELFINFSKAISTRGTVYNLPRPRGGQKGTNRSLVLREDQLAQVMRPNANKGKPRTEGPEGGQQEDDLAAFGEQKKVLRRHDPFQPKMTSSYKKANVNEQKKSRAARRK